MMKILKHVSLELLKNLLGHADAAKSLQSCLTLCDPMDCSPPGSSVHGILQARILVWVAISSSRGIFLTRGSNLHLLCLLHCTQILYPLSHLGSLLGSIVTA